MTNRAKVNAIELPKLIDPASRQREIPVRYSVSEVISEVQAL